MQKPFSLFTRRDDSSLHFVEATETFETAKDRAMAFSKLWPREYIIFNEMTGLKFFFDPRTINQIIGTFSSEPRQLFPSMIGSAFGVLHRFGRTEDILRFTRFLRRRIQRVCR